MASKQRKSLIKNRQFKPENPKMQQSEFVQKSGISTFGLSPQMMQQLTESKIVTQQQMSKESGHANFPNMNVNVNNSSPVQGPSGHLMQQQPGGNPQQTEPQHLVGQGQLQHLVGQGQFYGPATNPMFAPATGTIQFGTKNMTTTSIMSMPLGSQSASEASGDSDDTRLTNLSNTSLVPGRITDTEIRLKITGALPLWYRQDKPRILKYTKHMLHLFYTGVCALVSKTHIYFLKTYEAELGETRRHIKVKYSQVLFVKLGSRGEKSGKNDMDNDRDPNITYYSHDEGEAMIKTGHKGETHILIDHFALQKKQPSACECKDSSVPCKCLNEARRLVCENPEAYQQFTGTTNYCRGCSVS